MTYRKRKFMAVIICVLLVLVGRLLLEVEDDYSLVCAMIILFPGLTVNLWTHGVHGSWNSPLSEFVTVAFPLVMWYYIALVGLHLREKLFRKEDQTRPISPRQS
jgi:hypothetical protein